MTRPAARLVILGLLLAAGARGARAGMDDAEFRRTAREVKRVMSRASDWEDKHPLLEALAADDSRRCLELAFAWSRGSRQLVEKKLAPEEAKCRAEVEEYEQRIAEKRGADPERWSEAERSRLDKRAAVWRAAAAELEVEQRVQAGLARAVERATAAEALEWIASEGLPALLAERADGPLLEACVARLLESPPEAVAPSVLAALARPLSPPLAVRALEWVAAHRPPEAATRLAACLAAPSAAVQRAAIAALAALDDPRSVPLLIEGLGAASGLPAAEIETLLQRFTGRTFARDAGAWARWWKEEGEAWLAKLDAAKRFDPLDVAGQVSFYGIRTPSNRIAFVLDRSGSMSAPAVWHSEGPTVTPQEGKESWAGKTRLEVAKVQLARTINNLASDVRFTILFYDFKVDLWKPPPHLLEATREAKAEAQKWFMALEPGSSTSMFDGLMKALEYAEDLRGPAATGHDGIDTIFLLSDGAPTHFRGRELKTDEDVDAAYETFKQANALRRIVVHAIGVGQGHNEKLMRRIAGESGGKYVAVGMD